MRKTKLGVLFVLTLLVISVVSASMLIPKADKGKENANDKAPITPPGLEKVVFIHYKEGFAKPTCDNDGVCEPELGEKKNCADCKNGSEGESTCYAFLGKGVKWKEFPVDYVVDPDNPDGLSESFVTNAIYLGAEEWDVHTNADLFGTQTIDYNLSWDGWVNSVPDYRNELLFGDYPQEGVIAVTVTWGYFTGKPDNRKIIEFDVLFDTDFTWGNAEVNPSVMDLQNIATHEIGHGAGLADLYDAVCAEETMYGYSAYDEIKKRDLNDGDKAGITKLYG